MEGGPQLCRGGQAGAFRVSPERQSPSISGSRPGAPRAYLWWLVTGAAFGLGFASILTIGLVLLLVGVVLAVVGVLVKALRNRSAAAAVLGGLAVAPLYLAWLNRRGPGRVCVNAGSSTSCVDSWNPWPFLVVALLLIAASVLLVRLAQRRPRQDPVRSPGQAGE